MGNIICTPTFYSQVLVFVSNHGREDREVSNRNSAKRHLTKKAGHEILQRSEHK